MATPYIDLVAQLVLKDKSVVAWRDAGKVLTFAADLKLFAFNANSSDKEIGCTN
jgi:hypothetical protein